MITKTSDRNESLRRESNFTNALRSGFSLIFEVPVGGFIIWVTGIQKQNN